jgi:hypothetical protein
VLTVDVTGFTGYAAEGNANLTIDADDPKETEAEVHFTAEYLNVSSGLLITGANCTIYFTDGDYQMSEGATEYTYNRTFSVTGVKDYNVTCSATGYNTLTAIDTATITGSAIPEFNAVTLALGLLIVIAGIVAVRKR